MARSSRAMLGERTSTASKSLPASCELRGARPSLAAAAPVSPAKVGASRRPMLGLADVGHVPFRAAQGRVLDQRSVRGVTGRASDKS